MTQSSQSSLRRLTEAVWQAGGNEGPCPSEKYPSFRQLEDLITTTAWGAEAREEFFQRWIIVERSTTKRFEVGSFAELSHLVWEPAAEEQPRNEASSRSPDSRMASWAP